MGFLGNRKTTGLVCKHCGSKEVALSGVKTRYQVISCSFCGKQSTTDILYEQEKYPYRFYVVGAKMRFDQINTEHLKINGYSNMELEETEEGLFFKIIKSDFKRKQRTKNTYELTNAYIAETFRIFFNLTSIPEVNFHVGYDEKTLKIMGLVTKKQIIDNEIKNEMRKLDSSLCFLGVRRNGAVYLNVNVVKLLKIEPNSYVYLYEHKNKIYITVDVDDKENGFKVLRNEKRGFTGGFVVNNTIFASYLCSFFKKEKGDTFRINVKSRPVTIEEMQMHELIAES